MPFLERKIVAAIAGLIVVGILVLVGCFAPRSFIAVNESVGCANTGPDGVCWINQKQPDVPRSDPNNPPASWYVYGSNSEPIVTWLRRGQVAYNKWSMDNYISMIDHPTGVPVLPM